MSRLVEGLAELEKALRACQGVPPLDALAKLPRVALLLFSLLSALVHAVERQRVIVENLQRKIGGGDGG